MSSERDSVTAVLLTEACHALIASSGVSAVSGLAMMSSTQFEKEKAEVACSTGTAAMKGVRARIARPARADLTMAKTTEDNVCSLKILGRESE